MHLSLKLFHDQGHHQEVACNQPAPGLQTPAAPPIYYTSMQVQMMVPPEHMHPPRPPVAAMPQAYPYTQVTVIIKICHLFVIPFINTRQFKR